ncbi:MAG: AraC family transcriptional regulator [Lentisphaerae bacterium]|nr:MAG: AraC family transcriptional regulator [Lentisphaerota bacterium]
MAARKYVRKIDNGETLLEGYDVGPYPLHHFAYVTGSESGSNLPLRVISTGDDEWVMGCWRRRQNAQLLSIEFVVEGTFSFRQNGHEYRIGPQGMFLVQPGRDSEIALVDCEYGRKRVMEITGSLLPSLLNMTGLCHCDQLIPSRPDWIHEQFDLAFRINHDTPSGFMRMNSTVAYELLLELAQAAANIRYPPIVQEIVSYMQHKLGRTLSISELVQHFGISRASLHRLFKKHMGQTPINCFIEMKIDAAKAMLAESFVSIKEIAYRLGFRNPLYFSAEFKKRTGLSPRAYRLQQHYGSTSQQKASSHLTSSDTRTEKNAADK